MPLARPRSPLRRFAWLASALVLAVPAPSATIAAQQANSDPRPAQAPSQAQLRFVPLAERKPVPYELVRNTAVFRAHVNGTEVWALLDNRVTSSAIDEALARALGLPVSRVGGGRFVTPSGGALDRWRVPAIDLSIPGQAGLRAPVFATDLSRLSAFTDRPIAFIVGKEYFDVLAFLFNPAKHEFRIEPSGALPLPADTPHLVLANDRPQVEVTIAGQPVLLTIDLGHGGDIALNRAAWDRLGMAALPTMPRRSVDGSGTVTESVVATLDEVALGPQPVAGVKVALAPTLADDGDGYLGFGLLSRFEFALDIKARRLWLVAPELR